ncbi:MAG: type IX secretion system protein PorQ [Chitinophagaceae bacterium]
MQKIIISLFLLIRVITCNAQTIGGNAVFNFLKLPNTPQLTGLGDINISTISDDVGMSFNNPALLRPVMHTQLTTVFTSMYAGIKNYHTMIGYRNQHLQTNFAFGIHYLDYGSIPQTDAAGNILGSFRPADYVVQGTASRMYGDKWYYGASLKLVISNYGLYRSSAILMDVGAAYYDSSNLIQASLAIKNMGTQIKKYEGTAGDDMPFDLQIGITKRLQKAPLQFSVTAHHLHQFDIRYNDTSFNNENGFNQNNRQKSFAMDKLFRHFVFATQCYVGDKIEITGAYNHLRRNELNIFGTSNGLNGFSLGVGVLFKKIQIRYARAYYQNNTAYNQVGINLKLNEYFGLGNFGQRVGW